MGNMEEKKDGEVFLQVPGDKGVVKGSLLVRFGAENSRFPVNIQEEEKSYQLQKRGKVFKEVGPFELFEPLNEEQVENG